MSVYRAEPPQDDFARALLRSAEGDEPSNAAYAKVAAALGVSTVLGVGASLPAPVALAAGGSSALARWSGFLSVKLALLGVSGALLIGGGSVLLRHGLVGNGTGARIALGGASPLRAPAAAEPSSLTALKRARTVAVSAPLRAPGVLGAANAASDTAAVEVVNAASPPVPMAADAEAAVGRPARAAARAGRVNSNASRASSGSGSSLLEQVQSLDRARVALGAGDAAAALAEIAHYRQAWPGGVFLTEASVLEIEALAKRGERSLAAARAQAFVAAHPDSPQAERLRALILPAPASEQP